jgi:DNA-binding CsgD family transcriptional regulator/Mn-dependent DtxR family transcriptional regulator
MLEAFGVDPRAETIYLAMLRRRDAGTASLAASLGWSEDAVKAALDELARLSLLRPSWEDPAELRPVAPEVGLAALLAHQRADLLRRQHQLEEGRAAIEALVAEHAAGRAGAADTRLDELVGLDAVREALERLAYETQHEVLSFAPDGAQTVEALAASRPLNQHLLERGVVMRTIYLTSARNDQPTTAQAHWLVEMGAQVRTLPVLPLRLLVIDRARAVVPLDPAQTSAGACVVRSAGVIAALCDLFEQHWQRAAPWGHPPGQQAGRGLPAPAPTEQERALLDLLLLGYTDEQVARRMGVSTRTVGRMAADLMARLGARSRFQAGALATQQGWFSDLPP